MRRFICFMILQIFVLIVCSSAQELPKTEIDAYKLFNASLVPPTWSITPGDPCAIGSPSYVSCREVDGAMHITELYVREQTAVEIGDWIKDWPYLQTITINNVTLSRPLPIEIGSLPNLQSLYLWWTTNLQLPTFLESARSPLSEYQILDSDLTGDFPDLRPFVNLTGFALYNTRVTGTIPAYIGGMQRLQNLLINKNRLTGTIPPELKQLNQLINFDASNNQLTGTIPGELQQLSSLKSLYLDSNQLTGTIPWQLGHMPKLTDLRLSSNQLSGMIPADLALCTTLEVFDAGNNLLTGLIYPGLSDLPNLGRFNISNNPLAGCYNVSLPTVITCDVSGTNLCCIPTNPKCNTTKIDCVKSCPQPAPNSNAVCQVNVNREPVWAIYGSYEPASGAEIGDLVIVGNLTISGALTLTEGDLIVYGCATVKGTPSLSFTLTEDEVKELSSSSSIERTIFTFNSYCGTDNLNFGSITVNSNLQSCVVLKTTQNNEAEAVTVTITKDESGCKKASDSSILLPVLPLLAFAVSLLSF